MSRLSLITNKKISVLISVLLLVLAFIVASVRPFGLDKDSLGYAYIIDNISDGSITIEPSFYLVAIISQFFFDDLAPRVTLIIYSALNLLLMYIVIRRHSSMLFFSSLVYIFLFYTMFTMTQIRFGVASVIFLLAIKDIVDRDIISFSVKLMLATLFHFSFVIFFVFYFLKNKNYNLWLSTFLIIFSFLASKEMDFLVDIVLSFSSYLPSYISNKVEIYLNYRRSDFVGFNLLNSFSVFVMLVYFFIVFNFERCSYKLTAFDNICIKILGWGIVGYFLFAFFPTLSIRILNLSSLTILFLIPKALIGIKYRDRLLVCVFLSLFLLLYWINLNIINGLLNF